jgi:hypothetical protein
MGLRIKVALVFDFMPNRSIIPGKVTEKHWWFSKGILCNEEADPIDDNCRDDVHGNWL